MAGENNGSTEDQPKVDSQKQFLIEQFGNLIEKSRRRVWRATARRIDSQNGANYCGF